MEEKEVIENAASEEVSENTPTEVEETPAEEKVAETAEVEKDDNPNRAGSKENLLADLHKARKRYREAEAKSASLEERIARLEEVEKELAELREKEKRDKMRSKVISDKGLPSEWADLITGGNEEEMSKQADLIIQNLGNGNGQWPILTSTKGEGAGTLAAGREAAKKFRK